MHDPTRIDLLFTMSEITQVDALVRANDLRNDVFADDVVTVRRLPDFAPFELRRARFDQPARAAPRVAEGEAWWSQTGSNRRPHACKARALPAELWPRNQKTN